MKPCPVCTAQMRDDAGVCIACARAVLPPADRPGPSEEFAARHNVGSGSSWGAVLLVIALGAFLALGAVAVSQMWISDQAGRTLARQIVAWSLLGLACLVYLLPSVLAWRRDHPHLVSLVIVNIFLGWMLIPWVCALAWSLMGRTPSRR